MNSKKLRKYSILRILNGPVDFEYAKPTRNIGFKDPGGTQKTTGDFVWEPEDVKLFLKQNMAEFRNNVYTVAGEFIEAVKLSQSALEAAFKKEPEYMFSNLKYTTGVLLRNDMAIFYKIDPVNRLLTAACFIDDSLVTAYKDVALHEDAIPHANHKAYIPIGLSLDEEGRAYIKVGRAFVDTTAIITMFRTYADHEVKVVTGKSAAKLNNITYNNLNKQDIQVIDSTWYTTLVRTTGFMVRGHLRMQPCGKNWSERKLVYIDSFEKHGYVRRAKMIPTEHISATGVLAR